MEQQELYKSMIWSVFVVIYFDTEFYVPPEDRTSSAKLVVNPTQKGHRLLGGVFVQAGPFPRTDQLNYQHLWVWDQESYAEGNLAEAEKDLLSKVISLFQQEYDYLEHRYDRVSLHTVGIGQARFDLPALYIRANHYTIRKPSDLYRLLLSGFPVDLSNVGSALLNTGKRFKLAPVSATQLSTEYGQDQDKSTGMTVWQMFDEFRYEDIEQRTQNEVEELIAIYQAIQESLS